MNAGQSTIGAKSRPGTYALLLASDSTGWMMAGRRLRLELRPGFYLYVGSAFGPGGLRARLAHHLSVSPRAHWHIDYLRARVRLEEAWLTFDPTRREHQWATVAGTMPSATAVPGFGASDCDCATHLFHFPDSPSGPAFSRRLRTQAPGHHPIQLRRVGG